MNFEEAWNGTCSTVGIACRMGDIRALKALLKDGRPVDVADNRGWRPLHEAAYNNHLECVKILCSREENDVNWKTFKNKTPLFLAARKGHEEICRFLVELVADPDDCDLMKRTPLMAAAKRGHLPLVELLLNAGCCINRQEEYTNSTPLHFAIESSSTDVVKFLLSKKPNLFLVDEHRRSPVFVAAAAAEPDILCLLLEESQISGDTSALVNLVADDGASALMIAAQKGSRECVEMLLDFGANVNLVTEDNVMALHLAIVGNCVHCVRQILSRTDRDVLRRYSCGRFCKMCAECKCSVCEEVFRALDVETLQSPFHLAVGTKNISILKLLLNSKLDPNDYLRPFSMTNVLNEGIYCNLPCPYGVTAVGYAVEIESIEMLQVLLEGGCRADPDSFKNVSALCLAVFRKWWPGVEMLLKHGADPNFPMRQTLLTHPYSLIGAFRDSNMLLLLRQAGGDLRLCFNRLERGCDMLQRVLTEATVLRLSEHFRSAMGTMAFAFVREGNAQHRLICNVSNFGFQSLKQLSAVVVRNCVLDSARGNFRSRVMSLPLPLELGKYVSLEDWDQ